MNRPSAQELTFFNPDALSPAGLTTQMVAGSLLYTYEMLDIIDAQLVAAGAFRIANMFELANVSSMVGNLFGSGVANNSGGAFQRNGPHKYPDLIAKRLYKKGYSVPPPPITGEPEVTVAAPVPPLLGVRGGLRGFLYSF